MDALRALGGMSAAPGAAWLSLPVWLTPRRESSPGGGAVEDGDMWRSCWHGAVDDSTTGSSETGSSDGFATAFALQRAGREGVAAAMYHSILRAQRGVPFNDPGWCRMHERGVRAHSHRVSLRALTRARRGASGDEEGVGDDWTVDEMPEPNAGAMLPRCGGTDANASWAAFARWRRAWAERIEAAEVQAGAESESQLPGRGREINHPSAVGPRPTSMRARGTFRLSALHKLEHDMEQLRYLGDKGLLPRAATDELSGALGRIWRRHAPAVKRAAASISSNGQAATGVAGGEAVAADARALQAASAQYLLLSGSDFRAIGALHNTALYVSPEPAHAISSAINPHLDYADIERQYFEDAPGAGLEIVTVDNFLSPPALESLFSFCLESTLYFDVKPGYLGAYVNEGFSNGLLLQLFSELRQRLPRVMANHTLENMWAYKYDGDYGGIRIHADNAAVNFNLWLTPDEANLEPGGGGLHIYRVRAPGACSAEDAECPGGLMSHNASSSGANGTGFSDWNRWDRREDMLRYVREHGGDEAKVVVPYRRNRVTIFNSDLLHETAPFHFKRGYKNRRINLTMLFGRRPHEYSNG